MTDILLHGKTVLITSASTGLGFQFANAFACSGCRVILADISTDYLESMIHQIGNAKCVKMDISSKDSVIRCFHDLEKSGERIDICVNNTGSAIITPIFDEDKNDDFETIVQRNIIGLWYVIKEVAKHMKNHSLNGSIINVSSISIKDDIVKPSLAPYLASKSSMIRITKELAKELSPHHIRINCISHKAFHQSFVDDALNNYKCKNKDKNIVPLGFAIESPEDLDSLLLWLSSNVYSSFITGACIIIDGSISWGGA